MSDIGKRLIGGLTQLRDSLADLKPQPCAVVGGPHNGCLWDEPPPNLPATQWSGGHRYKFNHQRREWEHMPKKAKP